VKLAALFALFGAAAVPAGAQLSVVPGTATTPLGQRGFITDRAMAERAISFRPFLPDAAPAQVALLPPFHGAQVSANEGIGYAYGPRGHGWILLEWPRRGGTLAAFQPLPAAEGCADVHAIGGNAKPRGVAWTTPRGLVFALTPQETGVEPRSIVAEFRRLVRRGACR
jgi:hypothetical protein